MTKTEITAAALVRHAAEAVTFTQEQGLLFDPPSLDRLFKFVNSPDRLNAAVTSIESEMSNYVSAMDQGQGTASPENLRLLRAAQAAVQIGQRLSKPRGRLYREGPSGFVAIEI